MALTKISTGMLKQDAASSDLNIDAGTLYLDVSNNRVGVANTSPQRPLHVVISSGTTPTVSGIGMTALVQNNSSTASSAGYGIISGNAAKGSLFFGDAEDADVGRIQYEHNTNAMTFRTNASERMRINSAGNVGIGVTSPSGRVHADGDAYTAFIADGTSGGAFKFYKNGSQHAQIFSDGSGDLIFRNNSDTERMRIDSSGRVGIGTSPDTKLEVDGIITHDGLRNANTGVTATSKTLIEGEFVTVSAATQTITLPASPATGAQVYISVGDFTDTTVARNGSNIMGAAEDLTIDVANAGVILMYSGNATQGWRIF